MRGLGCIPAATTSEESELPCEDRVRQDGSAVHPFRPRGYIQTQTLDVKPSHAGVQGFDTAEMLDALQHGVDRSCTFGGVRHRTRFRRYEWAWICHSRKRWMNFRDPPERGFHKVLNIGIGQVFKCILMTGCSGTVATNFLPYRQIGKRSGSVTKEQTSFSTDKQCFLTKEFTTCDMTVADTGNLVGVFKLLLNIAPYKRPYSLLPLINEQPLKQGMHGERSALAVGLAPFESAPCGRCAMQGTVQGIADHTVALSA